jgi:glycine cleavage system H protein
LRRNHRVFRYKVDGDVGTVGITAHAAGALGDVVFVDLPSVGKKLTAGESFGSVESVKAASDVYSPVGGEVLEVNSVRNFPSLNYLEAVYDPIHCFVQELDSNPGMVNEAPFEGGWFMKLKV